MQQRGRRSKWSKVGALVGALGLVSCAGAGGRSGSGDCRELPKADRSELPPLAAPPVGGGSLAVELRSSTSTLERALDAEIPRVLAERKDHPIGAPGKATFAVTHGMPQVKTKDGKLLVVLPITIDISVCKPFGAVCVGYGKCQPRYDVTLTVSPELDGEYSLSAPRLEAKNREGCTIAIDVTDHVTNALHGELNKLKPLLRKFAERASDELAALAEVTKLPSGPSGGPCAFVSPKQVTLAGFSTQGDELVLGATLDFDVSEQVPCSERRAKQKLPPVKWAAGKTVGAQSQGGAERSGEAASPTVRLVESLAKAELEARVRAALTAQPTTPPVEGAPEVEESSVTLQALDVRGDTLLLTLDAKGASCGTTRAEVKLAPRGKDVVVSHVTVPGLEANDAFVSLLRSKLGTLVLLEPQLPGAVSQLLAELDLAARSPETRACGLDVRLDPPPSQRTRLLGTTAGLTVVTELEGKLGATLALGTVSRKCEF